MLRFETYRVTGVEALSIHLYRLATGARYVKSVSLYSKPPIFPNVRDCGDCLELKFGGGQFQPKELRAQKKSSELELELARNRLKSMSSSLS